MIGGTLSRFPIVSLIGEGGMGARLPGAGQEPAADGHVNFLDFDLATPLGDEGDRADAKTPATVQVTSAGDLWVAPAVLVTGACVPWRAPTVKDLT